MNLSKLKNSELHENLNSLVANERKLTHEILLHIAEVDRRKLFLEMAYPNLYQYLIEGIGYSAAAAQRRIDAARMMSHVPTIGLKIQSGAVNLTQINQIQKTLRSVRKLKQCKINARQQSELIEKIQGKTFRQTELILAQEFCLPEVHNETLKIQKDESTRVEITISKEEMAIIEQAQALISHSLEKQNLSVKSIKDILLYCSKKIIHQKTHGQPIKKKILDRDKKCQYKDPQTGKICGSKYYLEIDHIQPRWDNGNNSQENLRVLCSNHNKYRYKKETYNIMQV